MALRQLLLNNLGWKVASLTLAIVLYLSIQGIIATQPGPHGRTKTLLVPVTIMTDPDDPRGWVVRPVEVSVVVRGLPLDLARLRTAEVQAFVDVTDITNQPPLSRPVVVHTPGRVTVTAVEPPFVDVSPMNPRPVSQLP